MFYGAFPILFKFAKNNRKNPTETEALLWSFLNKNQQNGCRFKRQHPIKFFIADFYCHNAKLVIEVDGGYHDVPEQYQYDRERDNELSELGLKILHFTNDQVIYDIDNVLKIINSHLTIPTPL
jgi:cyclase